jgi:mannose-1-phosphate guanylyltransferase
MERLFPVILAGGVGERFWPCSRASRPKQLLPLLSSKTLLMETIGRAAELAPEKNIIIVTRRSLVSEIKKELKGKACKIIGEPAGRNTAPAIAASASWVLKKNPEGIMIVLSSDHRINPVKNFIKNVRDAVSTAQSGYLVVFGIKPSRPDIGYGYIHQGAKMKHAYKVKQFCEKPDQKTAKKFVKSENHLWNSGMFVWKASVIMEEFRHQMPSVYKLAESLEKSWNTKHEQQAIDSFYRKVVSESIDYGIMEGASKTAVVQATFAWDDVGSWEALWRIRKADTRGNVTRGRTISVNNTNSLLYADGGLVVASGLNDIVVVQSNNATLVMPRTQLPDIKKLIALVKKEKDLIKYLD